MDGRDKSIELIGLIENMVIRNLWLKRVLRDDARLYITTDSFRINTEYVVEKDKHILIEENGFDGDSAYVIEDENSFCPFTQFNKVKVIE